MYVSVFMVRKVRKGIYNLANSIGAYYSYPPILGGNKIGGMKCKMILMEWKSDAMGKTQGQRIKVQTKSADDLMILTSKSCISKFINQISLWWSEKNQNIIINTLHFHLLMIKNWKKTKMPGMKADLK